MSNNVDIDEADVAVLSDGLVRSKEHFTTITNSLNSISKKTSTASNKIKPIIRDVNKLTSNREHIEQGLQLLNDVSNYAAKASQLELILSNSIDIIGLKKFIDTLTKLRKLLLEMKSRIKTFTGILINFENLIDKSHMVVVSYFRKTLLAMDLNATSQKTTLDVLLILNYLYEYDKNTGHDVFVKLLSLQVVGSVTPLAKNCAPKISGIYNKGTNGIADYNKMAIASVKTVNTLLDDIYGNLNGRMSLTDKEELLKGVITPLVNVSYAGVLDGYVQNINYTNLINNDSIVLVLEVIVLVMSFEKCLLLNNLDLRQFPRFRDNYTVISNYSKEFFNAFVKFIENRIGTIEKLNDNTIAQVVVELLSRVRKIADYKPALAKLISGMKLGSWLNGKIKFIGVYTSVITMGADMDDKSDDFLLSSYFNDLIDAIMVNIEMGLRPLNNMSVAGGDSSMKKSTQGYHLVKNLILAENIINRSPYIYETLGSVGLERLNKLKNRFLKLFLDDWNYASYIIIRDMTAITTTNAMNQGSGKSNKEKEQIKELFKNFNESFEEALKNYEKFNLSDANLRSYLSSEIKKLIINAYNKLYDKYGQSDFTKNKAKYVKWDKSQFEALLNQKL